MALPQRRVNGETDLGRVHGHMDVEPLRAQRVDHGGRRVHRHLHRLRVQHVFAQIEQRRPDAFIPQTLGRGDHLDYVGAAHKLACQGRSIGVALHERLQALAAGACDHQPLPNLHGSNRAGRQREGTSRGEAGFPRHILGVVVLLPFGPDTVGGLELRGNPAVPEIRKE